MTTTTMWNCKLSAVRLCILIKLRCDCCNFYLNWLQLELPRVSAHTQMMRARHCCTSPSLFHYAFMLSCHFSARFFAQQRRHEKPSSLASIIVTQWMSCFTSYWWFHVAQKMKTINDICECDLLNHHAQTLMWSGDDAIGTVFTADVQTCQSMNIPQWSFQLIFI